MELPRNRPGWLRVIVSALAMLLVSCSSATSHGDTSAVATTPALGTATPTPTSVEPDAISSPLVDSTTDPAELTLVALGDSIPLNSSADCSGCVGYVEQYKDAIATATGKPVKVINLSSHAGLTSTGLSQAVTNDASLRASIAAADAITVSIGFNDAPMLVDDDPCDGAIGDTQLATYTDACIAQ
jgi:hypothetical protein